MDPVKFNLATFKYYDKRIASTALVIIIFVLGGVSLYTVTRAIQGQQQILSYQKKVKRLEKNLAKNKKAREKVRRKLKGEEMQAIREGTLFVNRIIAKDAFPWDRFLDAIETSIPKGVALTDLIVADDSQTVQMNGVAESSHRIDLLLSRLKKSGVFESSLLTRLSVGEGGKNNSTGTEGSGMHFEIESKLNIDKLFSAKEYEGQLGALKATLGSDRVH